MAAISYDPLVTLERFASKRNIQFPLLSDSESQVIDAYQVRNPEATGRGEGIPYPGIFILDPEGVIRKKIFFRDYRERPTSEEILRAVAEME